MKQALPEMSWVEMWLCEGCGEVVKFDEQDLRNIPQWQPPLYHAFADVCREQSLQPIVFSHDYFHTVGTRRLVYQALNERPELTVLEDITWPEENGLLPFWGFIPEEDHQRLKRHRIHLNCLTDTEYLGQGVLPCLMPRWWKKNVLEGITHGISTFRGRVFQWDFGDTAINFNRINLNMLSRFVKDPDADARTILSDAAGEWAGTTISNELLDILWQSEPLVMKVLSIGGVSVANHSWFPFPSQLDREYMNNVRYMKAVDDMFQPEGTPLYRDLGDNLDAALQWRVQCQLKSGTADQYLAAKDECIEQTKSILVQLPALCSNLPDEKQQWITRGYTVLLFMARSMRLFVEIAHTHYQWKREHVLNDAAAREQFATQAQHLRRMGLELRARFNLATDESTPLLLVESWEKMADFLLNL